MHDYAPVGCLENTMVGNDRSGTVDNNLNLLKAVELALTGGRDLIPVADAITGSLISIVDPFFSSLRTVISPPCLATIP